MRLPFFKKDLGSTNLYLGLFLKENQGTIFIFQAQNNQIIIKNQAKFHYSNGWESLAEDVDQALLQLGSQNDKQLSKTIIFVYSHLIDQETGVIKKPYIDKIKSCLKNLDLKPIGYIECHEAVINYIKDEEQMPLTSIMIEIDASNVSIFIYKAGRKIFFDTAARTKKIAEDIMDILAKIKGNTILPSRILLYDSSDLAETSTEIVTFRWPTDFFIQLPKVEIIREEKVTQSLMELLQKQLFKVDNSSTEMDKANKTEVMGFIIGGDVVAVEEKSLAEPSNNLPAIESPHKSLSAFKLPHIEWQKWLSLFHFNFKISPPFFAALGIGLIVVSLLLTEFFLHKVKLNVLFKPYQIDKEITLSSDPSGETEETIAISQSTISARLAKTKETVGKKQVGDAAKGEVTVHNFDDKEHLFTKDTELTSGGHNFYLDSDVKVPAATLTGELVKLPGKAKAKVTAATIGSENNLDKGQRFSFKDLSSSTFLAINEAAFSGGNKKEVRTVAKQDIDDLKKSLIDQGKKDLFNKIKTLDNEKIISSLTVYDLRNDSLSKELGEEAEQVNYQADVIADYYYFDEKELLEQLQKIFKKDVPAGYVIYPENIQYQIAKAKKDGDYVILNLSIKVKAIKSVDRAGLLSKIIGQNKDKVESIVKDNYKADGFEIELKPKNLLFFNSFIPFLKRNIELKISFL